tara:strand:- start:107 stop:502 length:396 start_codon:yes stop_codon:yes gene_type:complete
MLENGLFFIFGAFFTAVLQFCLQNQQIKKERIFNERKELYFTILDMISYRDANEDEGKVWSAEWTSVRMKSCIIASQKVLTCIHNLETATADNSKSEVFMAINSLQKEMGKDLGIKKMPSLADKNDKISGT